MTPEQFIKTFLPFAKETEKKTGFSALAILAQSAIETGWGKSIVGNMMFGVKDTDGINGNEQLVMTFEYNTKFGLTPKQVGLVNISSVKIVIIGGKRFYKYIGQAYFRKYKTPEESFTDHAIFLLNNKRYAAVKGVTDVIRFIDIVAGAGYAQNPTYASEWKAVVKSITKRLPK
jgi:flagellar protein FlgJ